MFSFVLCYLLANSLIALSMDVTQIYDERAEILKSEMTMMVGGDLVLSDSEEKANQMIMELKLSEVDNGFFHPERYNLSKHFFTYKDQVAKTQLFKHLSLMPKGAVLHVHDIGLLGPDYVLELTYMPDLYVCFTPQDPRFLFSQSLPNTSCETKWQLLRDARYSSGNVEKFDLDLKKHFSIVTDNPSKYTDVNAVWTKFQQYFCTVSGIMTYKPVWEKYFYDTLKAFRDDNIMYLEIRSTLPDLYDLQGNTCDSVATAEVYKEVNDRFCEDYPDFFGSRLIYAPMRSVTVKAMEEYMGVARILKERLPTFLAGFDLVGQEDLGPPTKNFMSVLSEVAAEFDCFFHAGETNWYGTSSDENLVDAILLGAKRIGHGYALLKHPLLLEEVKKRDIAVEVNVISNAVLKLVADVRNHPAASFIAQNVPMVVSSDDPGIWGATPLTHDFYVVFVGVASRHADLRLLKKLAYNSLYYSTYPDKDKLIYEFEVRWTRYIDSLVRDKW